MQSINNEDFFLIAHARRSMPFRMDITHRHQSYELYYLATGNISYIIDGTNYALEKGDLLLMAPHTPHSTFTMEQASHERYLLNVHPDFLASFLAEEQASETLQLPPVGIYSLSSGYQEFLRSLLASLLSESHSTLAYRDHMLQLRTLEVFVFLARYAKEHPQAVSTSPRSHPANQAVYEALLFIDNNYHQPITLQSIADAVTVSPYHLSRMFKQVTSSTLMEHVTYVRMQHAQEHLLTSRGSVSAIAQAVGFTDSSYFSRVFKQHTQMSPSQFRKAYSKKQIP